jgi:hypothetical protein
MRLAVPASLHGAPACAGAVRMWRSPAHSIHRQAPIHRENPLVNSKIGQTECGEAVIRCWRTGSGEQRYPGRPVPQGHDGCRQRHGTRLELRLRPAGGGRHGGYRSGPDMTAPPRACAREGVPWPVRRSPHSERRNMAPAERYSMKAIIRARGTLTHRQKIGTPGRPVLFQPQNSGIGIRPRAGHSRSRAGTAGRIGGKPNAGTRAGSPNEMIPVMPAAVMVNATIP